MINDLMNKLQINLFESPDTLVNLALSIIFDERQVLPRPDRWVRQELEY
jgi:hypothetical protein